MNSMTARIFALLVTATALVWACGIAWIHSGNKRDLERVLDARLEESSRMVSSLIENADVKVSSGLSGLRIHGTSAAIADRARSEFELACQIWSINGELVGRSAHAPAKALTTATAGFSNQTINGTRWRVFAHEDRERGLRVLVGDSIDRRESLVRGLIYGLVVPGVGVFFILSGLFWIALRQGLGPLHRLTLAVASRDPGETEPIDIGASPREIRPVVDALNGLLSKVVSAREHERSVTAYAAHELKTPLAGLRTQVQVALAANDPDTREMALRNAVVAVDQTTRMTRQLLALAEIEADTQPSRQEWINAGDHLRSICNDLVPHGKTATVTVCQKLDTMKILVNPDAFRIAARNLAENAVQHSPPGSPVSWTLREESGGSSSIGVEDTGPGLDDKELPLVMQRFYRGRNKTAIGSGLGLAIAKAALENDELALRLEKRTPGPGLRASIIIGSRRTSIGSITL